MTGVPSSSGAAFPSWWLLPILGVLWGVVAFRSGRSAWWGAPLGAIVWGGVLLATWQGGAGWRLAERAGGVFGETPAVLMILMTPFWGALLVGVVAQGVRVWLRRGWPATAG